MKQLYETFDLPEGAFQPRTGRMALFGKSDPPPAPDYVGAANATAAGNLQAAQQATQANRINQYTPYGSSVYTQNASQVPDTAAYQAAMTAYNQQQQNYGYTPYNAYAASHGGENEYGQQVPIGGGPQSSSQGPAPQQSSYMMNDPNGGWSNTVSLSPVGQQLLDASNNTALQLAGMQSGAADRYQQSINNPLPSTYQAPGSGQLGQVYDPSSMQLGSAYQQQGMGQVFDPSSMQLGSAYNSASGPAQGQVYDPTQNTNNATDLMMARLQPQMQRDQSALNAQMVNQGINPDSQAYNASMDSFNRSKNDAYNQAALTGITLGQSQQAQTYGQQYQNVNQSMAQQNQTFGQMGQNALARMQGQNQQFGQTNQNVALGMQQQNQNFNQLGQNALMQMQGNSQAFNQTNQNVALGAQTQAQQYQQQMANRNIPLNDLNAIRTGSQVQNPTFNSVPMQATTAGPDISGAVNAGYNANLGNTNAQNAQSGNFMNGLFGIGASIAGAPAGGFLSGLL